MITTRELSVANAGRIKIWRIIAVVLVPAVFLVIGGSLFSNGIEDGIVWSWLVGLAVVVLGIFVGFLLLLKVLEPVDKVYELFRNHDVIVEAPGCRRIERLALEQFNGELKPALHYVTESADLYRYERAEYMAEWYDYERDYIRKYYQKDPMRVAQASRTKALTVEAIRQKGVSFGAEDSDFVISIVMCSQKTQPSYLVDGDEQHRLYFGDYGSSYVCSAALYNMTAVGEEFYLVKGAASGKIYLAYPVADWYLDEELIDLLQ